MKVTPAINSQINPSTASQKSDSKQSAPAIEFHNVFELLRKTMDGVMPVPQGNKAAASDFDKNKLEIEEKRKFKTDLEEAQDILNQISRIMEKQKKG